MRQIIDFKSSSEYFDDEKEGLKNHTERVIDIKDERFQKLLRAWKDKNYPLIRISHSELARGEVLSTDPDRDNMYNFVRDVRHIAVWDNIMSITWNPNKEKEVDK